uniref:Uncharacterized protein n=1 Tax=Aegilops tauschii TaxID=37682 RepID=R7WEY4_AEGTA
MAAARSTMDAATCTSSPGQELLRTCEHHGQGFYDKRPSSARERLVTGSIRWEMVSRIDTKTCFYVILLSFLNPEPLRLRPPGRCRPAAPTRHQRLRLSGSCDGLLVLHNLGTPGLCYSIFNPTTRQYARLSMISGFDMLGMYQHRPTGEYRILYLKDGNPAPCYVFTLGSVQPPRITGHEDGLTEAAVLVHGCLHWYPQPDEDASDMIAGYESGVWTFKRSIKLPVTDIRVQCEKHFNLWNNLWNVRVVPRNGEFLVLVNLAEWLLHVDLDGKLVAAFYSKVAFGSTQFNLKQTLVPHTFFPALDGYVVNAPPFI